MEHQPFDLYRKVIPCTAAEVLTFHSVRKELVPAVPGHAIQVVLGFGFKNGGPAFGLVDPGNFIQARYNNTAKTAALSLLVAGFLDATAPASTAGSPGGFAIAGNEANADDAVGKSIVSGTNHNVDYVGSGSPITLVILYRLIPVTADGIAAVADVSPIGRF